MQEHTIRTIRYLLEAEIAKNRAIKHLQEILDLCNKISRLTVSASGMENWWLDDSVRVLLKLIRYFTKFRTQFKSLEKIREVDSRERKEFDKNISELDALGSALSLRAKDYAANLGEEVIEAIYEFRKAIRIPGEPPSMLDIL